MEYLKTWLRYIVRLPQRAWHWYKGLYRGAPWWKKWLVGLASLLGFFVFYLFAVYVNLFWLFGKSPTIDEIMHPENSLASEIYTEDGVLIGKYFNENRSPVTYKEVAPMFYATLIDTEDERFYSHRGVDIQGLFAAVKDMMHGNARGASTLTQQLVKNMFRMRTKYSNGLLGKIPGVGMVIMKTKEWILAILLESRYSKEDILTMYVNTVDFGSNAYGIKTAAKTYFDTTPARLKTEECAVLVGLLKATSTYNPKINPKNSLRRRNVVLDNLCSHGDLTPQACDSLKALPIDLNYSVENNYDGQALYFRQELAKHLKELFEKRGLDVDLYADGLKIYTTLNSKLQAYAEAAVMKQMRVIQQRFNSHWQGMDPWQDEHHQTVPHFIEDIASRLPVYKALSRKFEGNADSIDYYLNLPHEVTLFDYDGPRQAVMSTMDSIRYMVRFMHTGFVAMEPQTRHIKAWVGDIDYNSWKYDKVTSMRQPGSTFKAFVYAAAMNQGFTPCDRRRDSYVRIMVYDARKKKEMPWTPHNANGYFTGDSMTLRAAFAQSINSVAVKTGMEVGIDNIIQTAHSMGVKSKLDNTPSLTLGSSDMQLLELVNAYATIVADGEMCDPQFVTKIVDRYGSVIYDARRDAPKPVQGLPYRSAYLMQEMLRAGLTEPGATSMALWTYVREFDRTTDFGGKTGTSNNHSDAWYVGVTPALIGGAWVGGEYRSIHFRTGALGQGSRTALPIFGYFIQSVLNDPKFKHYRQKFSKPKEDIPAECYTCARYYRADPDSFELDSLDFSYVGGSDTTTHRAVRSADGSVHERMDEIIETIE
ncbi:MAG: penicillin-binding protein [Bacteroidaceae bacterium]|nr:penicillin-binding protein [Bacteroidaceae bacterium]